MTTELSNSSFGQGSARILPLEQVESQVRLAVALGLNAALTLFVVGTAWDTQWHVEVGRDRLLTTPHVLMLGGMIVAGLLSLLLVLLDSWLGRRGLEVNETNSWTLLGVLRAPFGAIVAGFGALLTLIAFPLDDYWHALYGIDVTLWAPFHVMIATGMGLVGVGALYLLASELNRSQEGAARLRRQLAFAATLAVTLAAYLLLLPQANYKEGLVQLGGYELALYAPLLALALPAALLTALLTTRQVGMASATAIVFLALRQMMLLFVPWATQTLVLAEGYSYRANLPTEVITPFAFPPQILLMALVLDLVAWYLWRRGTTSNSVLALAAALGSVGVAIAYRPWAKSLLYFFPALDVQQVLLNTMPLTLLAALAGVGLSIFLARGLRAIYQ